MIRSTFPALALLLVASAPLPEAPSPAPRWGFQAHRIINRAATTHLPADFQLFAQWANDLERLSTAADERKNTVAGERIKHYIDIDDYPEFLTGQLPHSYEDMVRTYGQSRVDGNGTVPWAIDAAYRDLVGHFSSGDWDRAVASAADIGHYVGDFHNPLHLTLNFNGQLTGQNGIHSRFESQMTSRHLAELVPASGTVSVITDPLEAVFAWIDIQYPGLAHILEADLVAKAAASGSTSSNAYYDKLWEEMGDDTITWIKDASLAVASLWYAAWIEAGSPPLPGAATASEEIPEAGTVRVLPNVPNPFSGTTRLRFELKAGATSTVRLFDVSGRQVRMWRLGALSHGTHEVAWDGTDESGLVLASGVYHIVVTAANGWRATGQAVLLQ